MEKQIRSPHPRPTEADGLSCDWRRTRFTLDAVCALGGAAHVLQPVSRGIDLSRQADGELGHMLQTAVSDDEVFHEAVDGHFWHFNYPVIDPRPGQPDHVTIATTRPETMLGDTAVAVPSRSRRRRWTRRRPSWRPGLAAAPAKQKPELAAELDDLRRRRKHARPTADGPRHGRRRPMSRLPLLDAYPAGG